MIWESQSRYSVLPCLSAGVVLLAAMSILRFLKLEQEKPAVSTGETETVRKITAALDEMDPDRAKAARVMNAFMKMKKFDIAAIERAYAGEAA